MNAPLVPEPSSLETIVISFEESQSLSLLLLLSSEEALSELPHPTASPAVIVATDKIAINFFNFIIILSLDSHLFSF